MKKVIAYIHTHWDREWYREFEEFRLRLVEVFNDVLEKLLKNDIPVFYFDGQTSALEDYLEIFPEKEKTVKELIQDKKLYTGPFFCSADEFLICGESFLRNLKIGLEVSKKFGCKDYIAYLSDTFGHSAYLSSILKYAGIDRVILWRGLGDLPADLNWNGLKTTYLIQGYFNDFLHSKDDIEKKAENLKNYLDKISQKSGDVVLLPIGADHLKCVDNIKEQFEKLNVLLKNDYEFSLSSPFEYFNSINNELRKNVSGEFLDNSLNFILQGVYSTRIDIKQANSVCERKLLEAEMFNAINSAFFGKENRQKQLDKTYKNLIKNHAHDSIYGCSTDNVCKHILNRFMQTEEIANGVTKRCIRDLSNNGGISALNLSNTDFSGITTIETTKKLSSSLNAVLIDKKSGFPDEILYDINRIPITEDYTTIYKYALNLKNVAPFSIKRITKNDILDFDDIKTNKRYIENEFFKILIKKNNIDITNKKNSTIYYDFIKLTDISEIGDSYNSASLKNDKPVFAKIKSVTTHSEKFIAFVNIEFEFRIPETTTAKRRSLYTKKHSVIMKIQLTSHSDIIDFDCKYCNLSKNHKMQFVFNTKKPVEKTVSEDLFGTVERSFDPYYDINQEMPAPRGKELKTNTMPINRFVIANNVGIITDGLKEIEIHSDNVAVTILRSTGVISNPQNPTRGTPAGPPIETPEMQLLGNRTAHFAVTFERNPLKMYEKCDKFFNAPILFYGGHENKQFIKTDNKNIRISSLKITKDNCFSAVLYNLSDTKELCTVTCPVGQIFETDLTEDKKTPTTDNILYFEAGEIKNIKVVM